jgi:hypothetical protein
MHVEVQQAFQAADVDWDVIELVAGEVDVGEGDDRGDGIGADVEPVFVCERWRRGRGGEEKRVKKKYL